MNAYWILKNSAYTLNWEKKEYSKKLPANKSNRQIEFKD